MVILAIPTDPAIYLCHISTEHISRTVASHNLGATYYGFTWVRAISYEFIRFEKGFVILQDKARVWQMTCR